MQLVPFKKYPRYQALAVLQSRRSMGNWLLTFSACVMIRPKTDQNTVKGLSGLKIKVIVELSTIENHMQTVFTYHKIFEFLMSMFLSYLPDWGEDNLWFDATSHNMCIVGLGRAKRWWMYLRSCTSRAILSFHQTEMTNKRVLQICSSGRVFKGRGQGFSGGRVGQGFSCHPIWYGIREPKAQTLDYK